MYNAPISLSEPVSRSSESVCGSADDDDDDELGAETIGETILDDTEASLEEVVMLKNLHHDMDKILATLTARESAILRCRYGLDNGCQLTFERIGKIFGASSFPLPVHYVSFRESSWIPQSASISSWSLSASIYH